MPKRLNNWVHGIFNRDRLSRSMSAEMAHSGPNGVLARWRSTLAPGWRRAVRALAVCAGFAIYLGAQLGIGYGIGKDQSVILSIVLFFLTMLVVSAIWPIAGLVALIIVTPIARGFLSISGGSSLPDIGFDAIMVPSLAVFVLFRTLYNRTDERKLNLPVCLVILYTIYCAANVWFRGPVQLNTLRGIVQYTGFWPMIYFIVLGAVRNERHVRAVLISLVVLAFAQGLALIFEQVTGYAYISVFYGRPIPLGALGWSDIGVGRSVGMFSNPVGPSVFLAMSIAISVHMARLTKSIIAKAAYLLAVPVICLGSFYTYTRNIYLMLVLSVLLMPLLAVRNRRTYVLIALTGLMLVAVLSPTWMEDREFNTRLTSTRNVDARLNMNRTALNMISHNLWFGVGWQGYTTRVRNYYATIGEQAGWIDPYTRKRTPATVHNAYLFVLAEEGLAGALLYFGSLIGFFILLWRYWRQAEASAGLIGRDLFAIFLLYLVLLFIQFVPYSNYGPHINHITWVVLGLGVRAFQIYSKTKTQPAEAA